MSDFAANQAHHLEHRKKLCINCHYLGYPENNGIPNKEIPICKLCGCMIENKVSYKLNYCPAGYWHVIMD